jgi:HSP20 family protein
MQKHHPLFNLVDEVLQHSVSDIFGQTVTIKTPSANIKESETNYSLEIVAPGLHKNDFSITVLDGKLIVSVDKTVDTENDSTKPIKTEWSFNQWKRSFNIGENIDISNIAAKYDLGVLTISLVKKVAEPKAGSVKIDIQ